MAVILILDRVNIRGHKRPRVQKIVCDGYLLYGGREDEDGTMNDLRGNGPVSPLEIARTMLQNEARPLGNAVYHNLREELARLGAEEREKARRERVTERSEKDG